MCATPGRPFLREPAARDWISSFSFRDGNSGTPGQDDPMKRRNGIRLNQIRSLRSMIGRRCPPRFCNDGTAQLEMRGSGPLILTVSPPLRKMFLKMGCTRLELLLRLRVFPEGTKAPEFPFSPSLISGTERSGASVARRAPQEIPAAIPPGESLPELHDAAQGVAYDIHRYRGPKPPLWVRNTHRYRFDVYVPDCRLALDSQARLRDLRRAMKGHILQWGSLIGKYRHSRPFGSRTLTGERSI